VATPWPETKVRELMNSEANVRLIAPTVTEQIFAWSREEKLCWEPPSYSSGDPRDAILVVSVADTETNAAVFEETEGRHIPWNPVDGPPLQPLRVRDGTGPNDASWGRRLGELRSRLFQDNAMDAETRRRIPQEQASLSA
jgi:Putative NAD(P)-binding